MDEVLKLYYLVLEQMQEYRIIVGTGASISLIVLLLVFRKDRFKNPFKTFPNRKIIGAAFVRAGTYLLLLPVGIWMAVVMPGLFAWKTGNEPLTETETFVLLAIGTLIIGGIALIFIGIFLYYILSTIIAVIIIIAIGLLGYFGVIK